MQGLAALLTQGLVEQLKEFQLALPPAAVVAEAEVVAVSAGGDPDLPRRHLPVDDDMAAALAFDIEDAVGKISVEITFATFQLGLDMGEDFVHSLLEFSFVHTDFLCFRLYWLRQLI